MKTKLTLLAFIATLSTSLVAGDDFATLTDPQGAFCLVDAEKSIFETMNEEQLTLALEELAKAEQALMAYAEGVRSRVAVLKPQVQAHDAPIELVREKNKLTVHFNKECNPALVRLYDRKVFIRGLLSGKQHRSLNNATYTATVEGPLPATGLGKKSDAPSSSTTRTEKPAHIAQQ